MHAWCAFFMEKITPHKFSIAEWFAMLLDSPPEALRLLFVLVLGELVRWCMAGVVCVSDVLTPSSVHCCSTLSAHGYPLSRRFSVSKFCLAK